MIRLRKRFPRNNIHTAVFISSCGCINEAFAQQIWSAKLLPGYDIVAGRDGEATMCGDEDSGGPLLRWTGDRWNLVGVYSGSKSIESITYPCLDPIAIYSGFGPEARHLVAR